MQETIMDFDKVKFGCESHGYVSSDNAPQIMWCDEVNMSCCPENCPNAVKKELVEAQISTSSNKQSVQLKCDTCRNRSICNDASTEKDACDDYRKTF